jgi:hypothetical protein
MVSNKTALVVNGGSKKRQSLRRDRAAVINYIVFDVIKKQPTSEGRLLNKTILQIFLTLIR